MSECGLAPGSAQRASQSAACTPPYARGVHASCRDFMASALVLCLLFLFWAVLHALGHACKYTMCRSAMMLHCLVDQLSIYCTCLFVSCVWWVSAHTDTRHGSNRYATKHISDQLSCPCLLALVTASAMLSRHG